MVDENSTSTKTTQAVAIKLAQNVIADALKLVLVSAEEQARAQELTEAETAQEPALVTAQKPARAQENIRAEAAAKKPIAAKKPARVSAEERIRANTRAEVAEAKTKQEKTLLNLAFNTLTLFCIFLSNCPFLNTCVALIQVTSLIFTLDDLAEENKALQQETSVPVKEKPTAKAKKSHSIKLNSVSLILGVASLTLSLVFLTGGIGFVALLLASAALSVASVGISLASFASSFPEASNEIDHLPHLASTSV